MTIFGYKIIHKSVLDAYIERVCVANRYADIFKNRLKRFDRTRDPKTGKFIKTKDNEN